MFLSPFSNNNCRTGIKNYSRLLEQSHKKIGLTSHFCYAWLEDYLFTLDKVFNDDWTKDMIIRYLG